MKRRIAYTFTLILTAIALLSADNVSAQPTRSPATTRQIQTLLVRIETKTGIFRQEIQRPGRNSNNGSQNEQINNQLGDFESAVATFRSRLDSRQPIGNEVTDLLNRAAVINDSMTRGRVSTSAASQWAGLKTDLNTLAGYYQIRWDWTQRSSGQYGQSGQTSMPLAYNGTDTQLRYLITQIESKTDAYKRSMNTSFDRRNPNNNNDSISSYLSSFEEATNRLKMRFNSRESTVADATEVLDRARNIDRFMATSRPNRTAVTQWSSLRNDLNTLATYYRVSWDWNQQLPMNTGQQGPFGPDARLTGTYRLNVGRSDNVTTVLDRSMGRYSADQRDNMRRGLERRLMSPEMIAIEKRGSSVSIGSSNSPQVTFEANGKTQSETNARGKTVTTTASADRNGITINYEGDRVNDFYVTFAVAGNNQLNVTRRIYLENQNETVTVSSVYDKISEVADYPTVNTQPSYNQNGNGNNNSGSGFYIPNGTRITTTLRGTVNTQASQTGDRFSMEVTSPSQYRGAIIEGRVAQKASSGRVSGRANITLEFDTISVNGRTYQFAGVIDGVTAANGDSVTVNNEGTVRDSSQTQTTAVRAGIGAVLGAIIGAVAGGGQGAAIGAGVGAGAGAGSVLITGRDTIELGPGSTFNITSTAPANGVNYRN